jgi:RsiW-degrading membrane proteinase PrsW (M82 family)
VDLTLLPLVVTPIVLLVHVIWMVDRPRREPIGNVIRYLGAGALAGGLAVVAETMLDPIDRQLGDPSVHWLLRPLLVFVGVGLLEELCKFAWLALAARADRALDEPFDWVVYSVSVSLGFAALRERARAVAGRRRRLDARLFAVPLHALVGHAHGLPHGARDARRAGGPPSNADGSRRARSRCGYALRRRRLPDAPPRRPAVGARSCSS